MSDAKGPADDRLDATQAADGSRSREADFGATEVDPYATALPTVVDAHLGDDPQPTIDDPHATKFADGVSAGGSTEFWLESEIGPTARSTAGSRYRPLRLHARGGLGEVYVAVDAELNREVALKEIQERHLDHPESRYRFVFEAEVTGGLEHPGIVPVYGLGRYDDGRPFYAMRFIRGDSLQAEIRRFHGSAAAGVGSLGHSLEFRQLVGRFIDVCHAIDYAHGRGVIHRDIKPENVMLGPHGETLVVDWGLAKSVDVPEPEQGPARQPLRPHSGDGTTTVLGAVLGTPAFMSPEQAAGEIGGLGPASDIFSLGSTLYAVLVGHGPFREKTLQAVLDRVRAADFPDPREVNRAVPPPLSAICRKAMARLPRDRYPSAALLAADLERWLADEPVSAYREPAPARLARWARRHRTAVAASFALLVTAATALLISNVLVGRERAKAERNYERARSAVERMLNQVGEVDLTDIPQMSSTRKDLLRRGLDFYRDFLEERGGDSPSRRETGRAFGRLGDIRELMGQYTPAEGDYRRAIGLLDGAGAVAPTDPDTRRALARARSGLGVLLKKSNRFAESEALLRRALLDREALARDHPGEPEDRRALLATRYQLGTLLARLKDRGAEDEALYREAIRGQEALATQDVGGPEANRDLARSLNNLGMLRANADPVEAEAIFRRGLKALEKANEGSTSKWFPGSLWLRARILNNLGYLQVNPRAGADPRAASEEARADFEAARADFDGLVADFPDIPDYRRERAITLNNLGLLLGRLPGGPPPTPLFDLAMADQRRLVAELPEIADHRQKLALTHLNLGESLQGADPRAAESNVREAVILQEELARAHPQVPEYQASIGRTLHALSTLLGQQGRWSDAIDPVDRSIRALELARGAEPRDRSYPRSLADARARRAEALAQLGRHADLADEAGRLADVAPDRPEDRVRAAAFLARAIALAGRDPTLSGTRRGEVEADYAARAIHHLRRAIEAGSQDASVLDRPDFRPLKGPEFDKLREDWKARGRKAEV